MSEPCYRDPAQCSQTGEEALSFENTKCDRELNPLVGYHGCLRHAPVRRLLGLFFISVSSVAVCATELDDQLNDHDKDGVVDSVDLDHDNDGLINSIEGYLLVKDPAMIAVNSYLPVEVEWQDDQTGHNQESSYTYRLRDTLDNARVNFHAEILSSSTSLNWMYHESSPKLQHQRPGSSSVRWTLSNAATGTQRNLNFDLTITDLDFDRRETVVLDASAIIGFSIAENSNIGITQRDNGTLAFTAESQAGDGSVTLHVRHQKELIIGYESFENQTAIRGLNNNRAGFRHKFSDLLLPVYVPVEQQRDTDGDGIPDHLDLDSDDDGVYDVREASGTDADRDGVADGVVGVTGIPASAESGRVNQPVADITSPIDVIIRPRPVTPVVDDMPTIAAPIDSDNDALTNVQELRLGTDEDDPDDDGVTDLDEVMISHSDPLTIESDHVVPPELADSDNDGIADSVETMFDLDADGIPNMYDLDSDNDGIADVIEAGFGEFASNGELESGTVSVIKNLHELPNFDNDRVADVYDLDSDQDGISDLLETYGVDVDRNGVDDQFTDSNADGWNDSLYGLELSFPDTDQDGLVDYLDADSYLQVVQNDDAGPAHDASVVETGVSGGAGCSMQLSGKDYGTLLLLLMAALGLMRKLPIEKRKRCQAKPEVS